MNLIQKIVDFLEEHESLHPGDSPWRNDIPEESFGTHHVDWDKLFPSNFPKVGNAPWDYADDPWKISVDDFEDILTPLSDNEQDGISEWDTCAWYQPIHFYGHDWGIYVKESCVKQLARRLNHEMERSRSIVHPISYPSRYIKALLRASFALYYRHELFHHKTECLGLRLHVAEQQPRYVNYFNKVYIPTTNTDSQLEESLANAFMFREFDSARWIPKIVAKNMRSYLSRTFPANPPGYRLAPLYLTNKTFEAGQQLFFSQVQEATLLPIRRSEDWELAPRLSHSFFNINSEIWTVVPVGARPLIPTKSTPLRTCSTDQLIKVCRQEGYSVVPGGKGSHLKLKKEHRSTIILPGNRNNLSPGVVKNTLAALGKTLGDLKNLV